MMLAVFSTAMTRAEGKDAIYAWVNGSSTCYKLDAMPTVSYQNDNDTKYALLIINSQVVLRLALTDGANLTITYGVYDETAIDDVKESKVTKNGKFIKGGRLVIVKDGRMFDTNGIEITK